MQVFELERRTVADAAVQAAYVVPALQEREQMPPCLFVGREVFATEQFGFECAEERLAHRVVNFNAAFHEPQLTSPSIKEFRRHTKPYVG